MDPHFLIVGTLTIGFALASLFAYVMQRLKLPSILGFLLAGYIIGPYSPGFVADPYIAEQLAEIGVILMLFGVGLHFKIEDLIRVKNIVVPGAILQTAAATLCTTLIITALGWSIESGVIIGLAIGVASTVVLVRILTDYNIVNTVQGHIAIGWLVVEDIFTVAVLILLPTLAAYSSGANVSLLEISGSILFVTVKFCVLALFMFTWGHKSIEYILANVARLKSQELFTLTIIALVFLIAMGSSVIFGTSMALGAFIAGMVIGKTNVRHQAAANALPLKDIFAVVFFLSVGMLFNPMAIVNHFYLFTGIIFVILLIKPLAAYGLILLFGYSLNIALTVAVSLAQIGEFSFILAEEAMNLKLIPEDGFDILVACAIISISLNSLFFRMIHPLESILKKFTFTQGYRNKPLIAAKKTQKNLTKVLVVGFGPTGKEVLQIIKKAGFEPVIIEQNIDTVYRVEKHDHIIYGDASEASILKEAHIEEARLLLITVPDVTKIVKIVDTARHISPGIQIIARIQYITEKVTLDELNIKYVCGEEEALKAFAALTLHAVRSQL